MLLCCGGGIGITFFVMSIIKSSDVYTESLARAKANPDVKALLGEPIEAGFFVTGNISTNTTNGVTTGDANFGIPLTGPKGGASLVVIAHKRGGPWEYEVMKVQPALGGLEINLMEPKDEKKFMP
jgi:hypothetical protein